MTQRYFFNLIEKKLFGDYQTAFFRFKKNTECVQSNSVASWFGGFKGGGAPLNSGAAQSGVRPKDADRECFVAERKNTKGRARGGSGANDAPKGAKRAANVSAGGRVGLPTGCPYGRKSAGEGRKGAVKKRE